MTKEKHDPGPRNQFVRKLLQAIADDGNLLFSARLREQTSCGLRAHAG
jgi:hypothetical protein